MKRWIGKWDVSGDAEKLEHIKWQQQHVRNIQAALINEDRSILENEVNNFEIYLLYRQLTEY